MRILVVAAVLGLASCSTLQPKVLSVSVSQLNAGQAIPLPSPVTWRLERDKHATAEAIVLLYEKDRGSSYTGSAHRDGDVMVLCFKPRTARNDPENAIDATEAYHATVSFLILGVAKMPSATRLTKCMSANSSFKPKPLRGSA